MKAVLISIQPKWCELIASGKKTVEVRKTKPKLETPFKVYIYETKALYKPNGCNHLFEGKGKVIGEFVCDSIANYEAELWDDETYERIQEFYEPDDFAEYGEYEYKPVADNGDDFWKENMLCKASCLTVEELRKYVGKGFAEFYGWTISDLVIYDKPKELSEFFVYCDRCDRRPIACKFAYEESNENGYYSECMCDFKRPIERPPQSWFYVERLGEG